ncbi:MAG: hypothetical protein EKK45_27220 [Curvibacter sp.]|nr:MAG: hypothetical protein EKK45_27220 [Curvibacter sp.]
MTLDWLDFDASEDTDEGVTFDAMASVWPDQLSLVLTEAAAVLAWARQAFGLERPLDEGGAWDVDLQAWRETQPARSLSIDLHNARLLADDLDPEGERVRHTVTLSLSGGAPFAEAFRRQFNL